MQASLLSLNRSLARVLRRNFKPLKYFRAMKRTDYNEPTMKIVKLQNKCQLLAGSDPTSSTAGAPSAEKMDYQSLAW
jgi:hypothetical protein